MKECLPFLCVVALMSGCSTTNYGKPLTNGPAVERYILNVFALNGCRMSLEQYKRVITKDGYPVVAFKPSNFDNKAKSDAAKSRLLLETAPFILQRKGLLVQDPNDKFVQISKGRGCQ